MKKWMFVCGREFFMCFIACRKRLIRWSWTTYPLCFFIQHNMVLPTKREPHTSYIPWLSSFSQSHGEKQWGVPSILGRRWYCWLCTVWIYIYIFIYMSKSSTFSIANALLYICIHLYPMINGEVLGASPVFGTQIMLGLEERLRVKCLLT